MSKALALHAPRGALPNIPTSEDRAAYRTANLVRASIHDDDWPKKIAAFRHFYNLDKHDNEIIGRLPAARERLQEGMLEEEWNELQVAFTTGDFPEQVDAILDFIYVGLGTLQEMGFSPTQTLILMEEVHASNMTKADDEGKPMFDLNGKVLKGANYVRESLRDLITEMRVGLLDHREQSVQQPALDLEA